MCGTRSLVSWNCHRSDLLIVQWNLFQLTSYFMATAGKNFTSTLRQGAGGNSVVIVLNILLFQWLPILSTTKIWLTLYLFDFSCAHLEVEPIVELSLALLDDDNGSDSDTDLISKDVLLTQRAYDLCASALQKSGMITECLDPKTLKYMQKRKFIETLESGDIVLARDAIRHGVAVANAVLENGTRKKRTTLEIQSDLRDNGWQFVDDLRSASLSGKTIMDGNPNTYYMLLTHFPDNLLHYEEEGLFHHKQGEPYYQAIHAAVIMDPDHLVDIPTYKKAAFYDELKLFLEGQCEKDPRDEELEKKRTGVLKKNHLFDHLSSD